MTEEEKRLREDRAGGMEWGHWRHWGPYLSERAWGTVREDYSADGSAWDYFPHDHARSRAYRWNEDGIFGICDQRQLLCFAIAMWNGKDPILKERMFGLSGPEGNHGEDVKEYWWYLDSTPTHSYMKGVYKYPQSEFPYEELVRVNRGRGKEDREYELIDTGIFDEDRYFDVTIEYAKAEPEEILIEITVANRGPQDTDIDLLPSLWFRNVWSWDAAEERPRIMAAPQSTSPGSHPVIRTDCAVLGTRWLYCHSDGVTPELLFTENDTNNERLFPETGKNTSRYVKDGINDYVVHGAENAVNPEMIGTKAAVRYHLSVPSHGVKRVRLRLSAGEPISEALGEPFEATMDTRRAEADAFYAEIIPASLSDDGRNVMRQALSGMLWSKQYYHYDVRTWLKGDPAQPSPPESRASGRNHDWQHLNNSRVMSMPDTWEYPWYAAWDLAFHTIPLALVDPDFAKGQLLLLLREWYMHPNGQLPAYEWAFGDVNPPVHAWAARRVFQIDRLRSGHGDTAFLERVFHKLLLNFTWWVNRKDRDGRNVFQGGFLGLDNVGIFDRSKPLPFGGYIDQSDGTSWMATYCLNMLAIALELAAEDTTYEDVASKFLEHFFYIAHAMNNRPATQLDGGQDLWDDEDGFYYDVLNLPDGTNFPLRVRSAVGLIPLLAVETLDADLLARLPDFRRRLEWFLNNRPDLCDQAASVEQAGEANRRLFSVVNEERLRRILSRMLDENEFLAPTGLRMLSRYHKDHPYRLTIANTAYEIDYEPAESRTGLFGGNSNWRGPIWMPLNYLIIEALQKFDYYYGAKFRVEYPTGSGVQLSLWEVASRLSRRFSSTFLKDAAGRRPTFGGVDKFNSDPAWSDLIPFYEYFHGDTGAGLGASHQTGWTGLVAKLLQQNGE